MASPITLPELNPPAAPGADADADWSWWTDDMATPVGRAFQQLLTGPGGKPDPAAVFNSTRGPWMLLPTVFALLRDAETLAAKNPSTAGQEATR